MRTKLLLTAVLLTSAACPKSAETRPDTPPASVQLPAEPPASVDVAALDRSVQPCDDFYRFACGGWMEKTPIPPDRPGWFRGFSEIQQRNQIVLRQILEDAAAGKLGAPYADKLGNFWNACMDEEQKASVDTLHRELEAIAKVEPGEPLARKVAELQAKGVDAFFGFGSTQDYRDVTQVIGVVDQGGLGLPDRDYYLRDDAKSAEIRENYVAHIARMFALAGTPAEAAKKNAQTVMALETALAQASMARVDRRDPYKIYNRLERDGLEGLAPTFAWDTFFATLDQSDLQKINVTAPDFFRGFDELLKTQDIDAIRTYLQWHLLDASAPALSEPFVQENFAFRSKNLTGEEQILPRWKRCVDATDRVLGEALARPYVALTFGEDGKKQAQELVHGIEGAFEANLARIDWMDDATKARAREKLEAVYNKIGYPDKWRNYDALQVDASSYLANLFSGARFETNRDLAKIGAPVDRTEWFMSPPTVNAYYSPLRNEMVFPAGILQTPFFDTEAPHAANAGGIGMVMGHELTHGFDDKGRRFDAKGNLREWWTPEVGKAYEAKAQCVVDQYAGYQVQGLNLNGKLTLGENIADIGGLKLAWMALQDRQQKQGEGPEIEGFTEDQQFFLSFAQSWCANRRPEYARMLVTTDPHSPPEYRVNGSVSNVAGFAEAFSCPAGAPMAPANRCEVW